MKTASRILGTAGFRSGLEVQDSPIYGAERRGAPMVAFVRLSEGPILERGAIERPHLVVVADDTLLDEPAASPLSGSDDRTTVLINATAPVARHAGPTFIHDFTSLALERTKAMASLSTALGVAGACLIGLPKEACLAAVREELSKSELSGAEIDRNVDLAGDVCAVASSWPCVRLGPNEKLPSGAATPSPVVELPLDPPARGAPSIYAQANTPARKTGSWRQFRPVLEAEKCNRCWLCFVWCPEAAIVLDDEEYPHVNYDVCKGCLLCAHECPTHAFRVEREKTA